MANIHFFQQIFLLDFVPAPTVREYHWYIVDYIYQSSKFTLHLIEQ